MAMTYIATSSGEKYFFDAKFKEDYQFENEITQHPVQSGANINDHVYQQPVKITFDIGVSDCLSGYDAALSPGSNRSYSAFKVIYNWYANATPLLVYAAIGGKYLKPFQNMLVKSFFPTKDKTTGAALRATVTLQQVIVTTAQSVALSAYSADPQKTDGTVVGLKKATVVKPTDVAGKMEALLNASHSSGKK